jgi:ParB family chromosome partitioning protein
VTRRPGLGRGLDALIPRAAADVATGPVESDGGFRMAAVEAIEPNPSQPRRSFDPESIADLAASIAELGVLQPLLVRPKGDDRFELIAGERRLRAARVAGLERVPVVVAHTDARGSLERALVENIHRQDLNPIEEAAAYRQLMDEGGLTQEELAARVVRGRPTIANTLRLLDLPVGVQRFVAEGRLSGAHGKALLGLASSPFLERVARRVVHEGLSVRATEELVRRYRAASEPTERGRERDRGEALSAEAERTLSDHLQARTRVVMGRRKGRIVVEFGSTEELDRIVKVIVGHAPGGVPQTIQLD